MLSSALTHIKFVWPCFVKHGMQAAIGRSYFGWRTVEGGQQGATAGSGPKRSRADVATHCAVAYSAPAEGARAGARQSKQWDLVAWPFTGTYYKNCYYATTVVGIWICID